MSIYASTRSVFLCLDPHNVPHCRILSPDKTEWRLISATLCEGRCCFVADQLWFMTCIREEEVQDKGAGSYLAGMAVAIPILNVDGRRHTNNFSKNI